MAYPGYPGYGTPGYGTPGYGAPAPGAYPSGAYPGYQAPGSFPTPPTASYGGAPGGSWFSMYGMPDPMEMAQYQGTFMSVDTDRSGQIMGPELYRALVQSGYQIEPPCAQYLVKMVDVDNTGSIGINEFGMLWKFINATNAAFAMCDMDRSGTVSFMELGRALAQLGFPYSPPTVDQFVRRYSRPGMNGLTFPQFLELAAYLGVVRTVFERADMGRAGFVNLNLEAFTSAACALKA